MHGPIDTVYSIYGEGADLDNRDLGTTEVRYKEYLNVVFDVSPTFALELVENALNNANFTEAEQAEYKTWVDGLMILLQREDM